MTSVPKYVFIDTLDDTVNKCNNVITYTTKMKPIDVKSNTFIDSSIEINNIDRTFKTVKTVWLKKLKMLCHGHMLLMILMGKKLLEHFMKKKYLKNKSKRV